MDRKNYIVEVADIGVVHETNDYWEAAEVFGDYKRQSQLTFGPASQKDVTLKEWDEKKRVYIAKREHLGEYEESH